MLDEKMQKKKVHPKDVTEEQLKVVVYSGHGDIRCESDFPRAKTKVGTVTREM
jgi:hypothetical protein